MRMELISDWRQKLFGSWSARLGFLSSLFGAAGMGLFVFSDELGDGPYFTLVVVFAIASWACATLVPPARVVRQRKFHDADE